MSVSSPLRILYTAYPMLPVSEASCGGAEQMLWALEAEMARLGHSTAVAACDESRVAGRLLATGPPPADVDLFESRQAAHESAILNSLADTQSSREPFDIVHDEGGSFWRRAAEVRAPVLATLHLPHSFYPAGAFENVPSTVFFNCVSESQRRTFAGVSSVLAVVPNGIRLEYFPPPRADRDHYVLWLGRICPEKGTHLAIEVARRAGMRLVIAGDVYPFSYHLEYFRHDVFPQLQARDAHAVYVGAPSFTEKLKLLRRARALLVTNLAEETSSLAAMEAMACGTPVLAFRRGALPEVVDHGRTGFVVDSVDEMCDALRRVREITPSECRSRVQWKFSAIRMARDYEVLYRRVCAMYTDSQRQQAAA